MEEGETESKGDVWQTLLATVEQQAIRQPVLQQPTQRWAALLAGWVPTELPPLVLYLDNLESLLHGPAGSDPEAVGQWRDEQTAALWPALTRVVENAGGRLALLASCRYRNPDFGAALMPFGRLPPDALWRMMGWFPHLRLLAEASRDSLVERLAGHPRGVEFLDGLVGHEIACWQEQHGSLPAAESEWEKLVAPALPKLGERLSEDLLFAALWTRVLAPASQQLLVRATVLRLPAGWALLRVLTVAATDEEADNAIRQLRDTSLLTEVMEQGAEGGLSRRFEVHPNVATLARQHTAKAAVLCQEGHRRAGDFLEQQAAQAANGDEVLEAAYHLGEVGEVDRAFELLLDVVQWLQEHERILDSLSVLKQLQQPAALSLRNRGAYFLLRGEAYASLGDLTTAYPDLRQSVANFKDLTVQDPSHAGWQRDLSVSFDKVGDVLVAQGRLEEALGAYQDSLAIAQHLAEQDPSHAGWQRDLSVSFDKVGDVLVAQGRLEEALGAYQDSLAIAQHLAEQDPSHAGWQRDLSVSFNKIGDVLVAQGRLEEALGAYQDSLAIAQHLAEQDPSHAGWQRDLSVSFEKIGDVLVAQGRLEEALGAYQDSLAIAQHLAEQDPSHAGWQRDLSVSFNKVGDVLVAQGRLEEALGAYQDSLAIAQHLAEQDPSHAGWQRDLSVSFNKIGDVLVAQGRLEEALGAYQDSLAIRQHLAEQDPSHAGWQRDLSVSFEKIGDVLVAQGRLEEALGAYQDSLAIRQHLAEQDPSHAGWQRDLSVSFDKVGDVLVAQGRLEEALGAYQDSLAIAQHLAEQDPSHAGWQRDLSVSFNKVGDVLVAQGRLEEALGAYQDSLAIASTWPSRTPAMPAGSAICR